MLPEQAYAMVFAPHPDDEGAIGGTIARWTREGKNVVLVVCTNGDKGSNDPKMEPSELVKIREKEERAAAECLGVRDVIFLGHPDQTLADEPVFQREVTRLLRLYRPEVVATTDPLRRYMSHPDHRNTGRVVLDSIFLYSHNLRAFPELYFEEGLELHRVKDVYLWGAESPNVCMDITDTFETKMAANACHISQFGEMTEERTGRMRDRSKSSAEGEGFEMGEPLHKVQMGPPQARPRPEGQGRT